MSKIYARYFYAIRIKNGKYPAFLARGTPSAPILFWFHEDAVKYLAKTRKSQKSKKSGCHCFKCNPKKSDIVKVFVRWNESGGTYNESGDMFRSAREIKRKRKS